MRIETKCDICKNTLDNGKTTIIYNDDTWLCSRECYEIKEEFYTKTDFGN